MPIFFDSWFQRSYMNKEYLGFLQQYLSFKKKF